MIESIPHLGFLFARVYSKVRPRLKTEYARWLAQAGAIPDGELRRQALASLELKKFHLEGGLIYVAQVPTQADTLVPLITAYQTLCDYLDNLCDRSTSQAADDFRQLHASLQDALTPGKRPQAYYALRSHSGDGGYMTALVQTCQSHCARLPSYELVQPRVLELSRLYSDLQVYKHIAPRLREQALLDWHEAHRSAYPLLRWQEFAAATGSTLGIFEMLCEAAQSKPDVSIMHALDAAYFPWISGLHILLDYLVDLDEDRLGGDLNFVQYYGSDAEALQRMSFIVRKARTALSHVPAHRRRFHELVVDGLIAFYLADTKVKLSKGRAQALAHELRKQVGFLNNTLSVLHRRITGQ